MTEVARHNRSLLPPPRHNGRRSRAPRLAPGDVRQGRRVGAAASTGRRRRRPGSLMGSPPVVIRMRLLLRLGRQRVLSPPPPPLSLLLRFHASGSTVGMLCLLVEFNGLALEHIPSLSLPYNSAVWLFLMGIA